MLQPVLKAVKCFAVLFNTKQLKTLRAKENFQNNFSDTEDRDCSFYVTQEYGQCLG